MQPRRGTGHRHRLAGRLSGRLDRRTAVPGPFLDAWKDAGQDNDQWTDHETVEPTLAAWFDAYPDGCLQDNLITGLAKAIMACLASGGNAYLSCAAGVPRASHIDVAVHRETLGVSANHVLADTRAAHCPAADPSAGFLPQLQRRWP